MQFGCESCKAQLQIADEKVRGRRLIVRCRRCGAKIALADPALADSSPRLIEPPSAPGPMRIVPQPVPERQRRDTDNESTRAMDSELLERALQASRGDELPQNGAPATQKLHFPAPAVPLDGPIWYAMIRGKQAGPVTRDELEAHANEGEVGPRTYLWREGMDAWQHAKDIPDMSALFPQLPAPAAPPPAAGPAQAAQPVSAQARPPAAIRPEEARPPVQPAPVGEREQQGEAAGESGAVKSALDLARSATSEMTLPQVSEHAPAPHKLLPPVVPRSAPMFEGAVPAARGPFVVFLALIALAAAAIILWIALAAAPDNAERTPGAQAKADSAPAPTPAEPATRGATTGLTPDQVHRKLDENKPALQGCVDDAIRRDPKLRVGRIHVATTIAPTGHVTAARIDQPSVDESALGACLKGATKKIVFPQFAGAAFDVDIPIVVTAGEQN
jgi:predicted Zn finger-like uncharacterized protein